ncbi:Cell wall protein RBR3, partial [Candida tropicalis]
MYMGASGVLPSVMSITAASWDNENLMVFYQNQRNSGNVLLGTPLGSITNNGNICLFDSVYQQTTAIKGSGCITADDDSTIYISNSLLSVDTNQNLYLKDSDSSIIAQALSTPQTFNVYGFGNGNKIGVTLPLVGNLIPSYPAYSYDESTGILTLRNLLVTQRFNIGTGYDPDLFQIVTDSGAGLPSTVLGSLQYNGPVPDRTLPSSCQIECKQLPEAPGTEPTEYTTTITTTASDGSEL